ncbi:MAG: hypothetical protein EOO45_29820 [Flavobacterium sp.]|nr:MAG: hypothetical protein EOO45_29820 [Flavobacterium sp.]
MKNLLSIVLLASFFMTVPAFAQEDVKPVIISKDTIALKSYTIDANAPARAAFYSAVLPGLGQVYNKKYWKVPIVYGGMGLSYYYYNFNNKEYHRYRDAYRDKLAGREVTGELANIDNDRLIRAQRFHQRNRDLSLLITVGIYILNIVDANVDAHLKQFNVNENLSVRPGMQQNQIDYKHNVGLTLSYEF